MTRLPPAEALVLGALARCVPRGARRSWRDEWTAELCWLAGQHRPARQSWQRLAAAARHALWLRWDSVRLPMMNDDLRHAWRALRRRPGYALATILTVALGIGASTAVYSAAHAVLWRDLPFGDPSALVFVSSTTAESPEAISPGSTSPPDFHDWRERSRAFSGLAAVSTGGFALSASGSAERVTGAEVTGDFFEVLGTRPVRGRLIQPSDDPVGSPAVVVISDAVWRRLFGADPTLVGKPLSVDGVPHELIGIAPASQAYPLDAEVWVPLRFSAQVLATQRGAHYLSVIGRLRTGVTLAQAKDDMRRVNTSLMEAYPTTNREGRVSVFALREALVGDVRPTMWLLLAAVVVLLLVGCVNVAGLMLTQSLARARDVSVRLALGAGRGRLIRAQLLESVIISTIGGLLGIALAQAAGPLIASMEAPAIPRLDSTRIDTSVLLFAAAVTIGSALAFGIWPAWRAARATAGATLATGVRLTATRGTHRLRQTLVAVEVGLAVSLLVGAALITRSVLTLSRVDLGFDGDRVRTGWITLPEAGYPPDRSAATVDRIVSSLESDPSVSASGAVFGLPLSNFNYYISGYERDGVRLPSDNWQQYAVQLRVVAGDYFRAMGIELRQGRVFDDRDQRGQPPSIVIDEAAAAKVFGTEQPLGRQFTLGTRLGLGGDRAGGTIVGVVGSIRDLGPASTERATVYLWHRQFPVDMMALVVQGHEVAPAAALLHQAVAAADPTVPVYRVRTMDDLRGLVVAQPRLYLLLIGSFAAIALTLAGIGIYGVMAQMVAARGREIGIRLALGATRERVVWMIARQAATLAALGVVGGWALAGAGGELVASTLHGITATDTPTYLGVGVLAVAIGVLSSWLPARRAGRIDPARTLQAD